jgi:exopolyphosphatase / guanosine-5'-triphosphate,3'-diphosphate pyrophosphatase
MKGAVIDLGTNTFNLLVFEKLSNKYNMMFVDREPVGLGLGGILQNEIAPDAFERGIAAIQHFYQLAQELHVDEIRAFGTSALRDAKNREDFCHQVAIKTGITIQVIDGHQEATYIYKGVKLVHDYTEPAFIMDIGGGSTEFILADQHEMLVIESFNIGVSRMLQQFNLSDPLSADDVNRVEHFLNKHVGNFFQNYPCTTLIGASGSFETFYEFIYGKKYVEPMKSAELAFDPLMKVLNQLIGMTEKERMLNDHISDIRKRMIHLAALKTKWVIEQMGATKAWISPASLKEGVMSEF